MFAAHFAVKRKWNLFRVNLENLSKKRIFYFLCITDRKYFIDLTKTFLFVSMNKTYRIRGADIHPHWKYLPSYLRNTPNNLPWKFLMNLLNIEHFLYFFSTFFCLTCKTHSGKTLVRKLVKKFISRVKLIYLWNSFQLLFHVCSPQDVLFAII